MAILRRLYPQPLISQARCRGQLCVDSQRAHSLRPEAHGPRLPPTSPTVLPFFSFLHPPMKARGNGSTPSSQSSNGGADGRALWREKRYELVKRYRLHRADCVPSLQGPSH
jgi:hypothetical protein